MAVYRPKPSSPRLDRSNPLARDCFAFFAASEGAGAARNLVDGDAGAVPASWTPGLTGPALVTASTQTTATARQHAVSGDEPLTIFVVVRGIAGGSNWPAYVSLGTLGYIGGESTDGEVYAIRAGGSNLFTALPAWTGVRRALCLTHPGGSGATGTIYADGVVAAQGAMNTSSGSSVIRFGGYNDTSGARGVSHIEAAGFWRRELSASEVRALAADPFAPVRPRSRLSLYAGAISTPGGTTYEVSITESVTPATSLSASLAASASIADSVTLADVLAASLAALASTTDAVTPAYSLSAAATIPASVSESINPADAAAASLAAVASISAGITLSDALASQLAAVASADFDVAMAVQAATTAMVGAGITEAVVVGFDTNGVSFDLSVVTPDSRTYTVSVELRTLAVPAEVRTLSVPFEPRTLTA